MPGTAELPKLEGCKTFYGIQVAAIGEDEQLLIIGHHDDRRTVAALNAYSRKIHHLGCLFGDGRSDPGDYLTAAAGLDRTWAVFREADPESESYWHASWCAEDAIGAVPVTVWIA